MAKKVECLKVGDEIFQIGDVVEIPMNECDGHHIYKGRIDGFEEVGQKCPPDIYVRLDTSTQFNNSSIRLWVDKIKSIKKTNLITNDCCKCNECEHEFIILQEKKSSDIDVDRYCKCKKCGREKILHLHRINGKVFIN